MAPLRQYPFISVEPGVDWRGVDPDLLAALNMLGRARGEVVTLTSGRRTTAEQAALYERYRASGFNIRYIAAKPGESNHERGEAVDVVINGVPIAKAASKEELATVGLRTPVKGDLVHTELAKRSSGRPPAPPAAPAPAAAEASAVPTSTGDLVAPALGTPPAAQDPGVEMPGTAEHYLPGQGGAASSWQAVAALPDLSPDTQRLIQLATGGPNAG